MAKIQTILADDREVKSKKAVRGLLITLVLMLFFTILAWGFASDWGSVKITRTAITLSDGKTIAGVTLIPKTASDANPVPAVVMNHGANSTGYDMMPTAIELSRRGYAVIAMDRFDCGESDYVYIEPFDQDVQNTMVRDVIKYVDSQDWVQDGITVTGTSQGGLRVAGAVAQFDPGVVDTIIPMVSFGFNGLPEYPNGLNVMNVSGTIDYYVSEPDPLPSMATYLKKDVSEVATETLFGSFEDHTAAYQSMNPALHETIHWSSKANRDICWFMGQAHPTGTTLDPSDKVYNKYAVCVAICMILFLMAIAQFAYALCMSYAFNRKVVNPLPEVKETMSIGKRTGWTIIEILIPFVLFFTITKFISLHISYLAPVGSLRTKIHPLFKIDNQNSMLTFILVCSIVSLIIMIVRYIKKRKTQPITAVDFGTGTAEEPKFSGSRCWNAFLIGSFTAVFGFTWIDFVIKATGIGYVLNPFGNVVRLSPQKLVTALPYLVVFLFCMAIFNFAISTTHRMKTTGHPIRDNVRDIIFNVLVTMGPYIIIFLEYYVWAIINGYPDPLLPMSWHAVMVIGCIPAIPFTFGGGVAISTFLYKKTGNIYVGTFTSSFVVGLAMVAYACLGS